MPFFVIKVLGLSFGTLSGIIISNDVNLLLQENMSSSLISYKNLENLSKASCVIY